MEFNQVKAIVDNKLGETEDIEKQANNLAKRTIEKEENQKPPKKDSFKDMVNLAASDNVGKSMLSKVKQQQKEENPDEESKAGRPKGSKNKSTTTSKRGPGRPPKKEDDKKRGPGRPPKKDKEEK